jgi:predicted Zn-dependent protease
MFVRLLVVMLAGMTVGAQERQIGRGVNLYSKEKEAKLGATLAEEIRRNSTALDSAVARNYVEWLGRQIRAQLPGDGVTYRLDIITGPTNEIHEPISLPGGYIFIPAGLFLAAQDEAEFAGMLAHAMAHVAERHGTRTATRRQLVGYSSIPLIFLGGSRGIHGASAAVRIGFLTFARGFEREADLLAAQIMARAGYDPVALVRYIKRLQTERTDQRKRFSPLPSRDSRASRIERLIRKLPARTYSSSDKYQRIREEVRGLTEKPTPRAPSLR